MEFFSIFSTAYAQTATAAAPAAPNFLEVMIMPLGFLIILYFFIIRPQGRKARDHAQLLQNLKAGDEVITSGGIIGRVRAVAETFVTVEIANNTSVKVLKQNIAQSTKDLTPATPAK